eukprot:SAG25_NODE_10753_length_323_cov_1.375000_1_plen_75_part_01
MLNMLRLGRIRRSDYGTNEDLSYCNRRTGITITIWVVGAVSTTTTPTRDKLRSNKMWIVTTEWLSLLSPGSRRAV